MDSMMEALNQEVEILVSAEGTVFVIALGEDIWMLGARTVIAATTCLPKAGTQGTDRDSTSRGVGRAIGMQRLVPPDLCPDRLLDPLHQRLIQNLRLHALL